MKITRLNNTLRLHFCNKYYCNKFSTQSLSDFPTVYKFKDCEQEWYEIWEKGNYFKPTNNEKTALKMLLPPPNITGSLHLGHALTVTIQDILARWYRMQGCPVVWVPGFDHAGIATQLMVEKHLLKTRGINKAEISKEEFLSLIDQWQVEKRNMIKDQLKGLGASLDWSREYFTMSQKHNNAVVEAFVTLSSRNLLYRKKDFINWSPTLRTTISEFEVERVYVTKKTRLHIPGYEKSVTFGEMAYIAFPVKDAREHEIIVATTRPETIFGDVAIAVHPDDERYAKFIGQEVWHPLRETYIPVISDTSVVKEFSTGACKVTPAHSIGDYNIALNHKLDVIDVIDEYGKITDVGKEFKGLPRFIAREKVLDELSNKGVLRNVTDHEMCIPLCSRSHDVIEYLLKEQWFVRTKSMAEKAVQAIKENRLKIIPTSYEEVWYNYLDNIRDWCISRQICWGHPIPAYYVTVNGNTEWIVARTEDEAKEIAQNKYGPSVELLKNSDVLDTWFSSALLPFAAMGWPKETEDFKKYYPLTLMETGSDILFFWVARMVMLGIELTNRLPFEEVLLHGLLCDAYGKKMSKSFGNIVLPENVINGASLDDLTAQLKRNYDAGVIDETVLKRMTSANKKLFPNGIPDCGADALRMTLCAHNVKRPQITFEMMECRTHKFFSNKIWQAGKYILLMTSNEEYKKPEALTIIDRWILSRLALLVETVNDAFTQREFHKAVASIKQFLYYEFCDYYLEATKFGFRSKCADTRTSHTYCLRKCMETFLRVAAPVIPYISDELYKRLSDKLPEFLSVTTLMEAPYPAVDQFKAWRDESLDEKMQDALKMILDIRSIMSNIPKKINPEVNIVTRKPEDFHFYNSAVNLVKGGSKIYNIFVFPEQSYTEKINSVCYSYDADCTLFIITENSAILKQLEKTIENKSVVLEKRN